jgi:hypothetical protein
LDQHQTNWVSQQCPPIQTTFVMDPLSSPSLTLESDYSGWSPSTRSNTGQKKAKKDKNQKEVRSHPSHGFRLRDVNANASLSANEENEWKFQLQMGQAPITFPPSNVQTMPPISPIAISGGSFTGTGHSSRSSSTGYVHEPADLSRNFATQLSQSPDETGMPPRKRPVLRDIREQQPTPFVVHDFDQGPCHTQHNYSQLMLTYDGQCPGAGTMGPVAYRAQTPYLNTGYTPTPSSIVQPTTYFAPSSSYGPAFADQRPSSNVMLHTQVAGNTSVHAQPMMSITPMCEQSEIYPIHPQVDYFQNHAMIPFLPHAPNIDFN